METIEVKEEQLQSMLRALPLDEREEARYRITRAELDGIMSIGLWTGDEPPDMSDLVGMREALPSEVTSWVFEGHEYVIDTIPVWLHNYKSSNTQGTE